MANFFGNPGWQLRHAAEEGNAPDLRAALAAGADLHAVDERGTTALHVASGRGNLACVRALLAAGADPNAADSSHDTPLHRAAANSRPRCVAALLAGGGNPAVFGHRGGAAVHLAAGSGCMDTVRALLDAAPQLIGLRDSGGVLPHGWAAVQGHVDLALRLMEERPLLPAGDLLASLQEAVRRPSSRPVPPCVYTALMTRQPLTPADWALVPMGGRSYFAALPAVLARSEAEAAQLLARLSGSMRTRLRERLCTAALCIKRAERLHGLELPPALLRPLLAEAVA